MNTMKNKSMYKILFLCCGLIYLPAMGFANLMDFFLDKSAGGAPVAYMSVKTPGGQPYRIDDIKLFIGTSVASPCSDLSLAMDQPLYDQNDPSRRIYLLTYQTPLTEQELQDILGMTPITCMKVGVYYKSTGHLSYQTPVHSELVDGRYEYKVLDSGGVIHLSI